MYYFPGADNGHTSNAKGIEPMIRRHRLPMILTASALMLAACSPSRSGNITATDNGDVAELSNDATSNDDVGPADNSGLVNELLGENDAAPANATGAP